MGGAEPPYEPSPRLVFPPPKEGVPMGLGRGKPSSESQLADKESQLVAQKYWLDSQTQGGKTQRATPSGVSPE